MDLPSNQASEDEAVLFFNLSFGIFYIKGSKKVDSAVRERVLGTVCLETAGRKGSHDGANVLSSKSSAEKTSVLYTQKCFSESNDVVSLLHKSFLWLCSLVNANAVCMLQLESRFLSFARSIIGNLSTLRLSGANCNLPHDRRIPLLSNIGLSERILHFESILEPRFRALIVEKKKFKCDILIS